MKRPGILWMAQVAAGLFMAGPMFVAGAIFLRSGDLAFGILLFAFGLVALFAPNFFVRRIGGPRTWIRRRLRRRRQRSAADDESTQSTSESKSKSRSGAEAGSDTADPAGNDDSSGPLERVRNRYFKR
ncbi:hypothetical protein [Natronosalvus vescus]|uniref:hypothetical protein n=1 Tax=Natronosalvus vescus TaxID=2953881 RepID=UPI0020904D30|nr:hypothetical protein [Natronosalvus vescus]